MTILADTKISAATDAGAVAGTDRVPIARSGSTTAYSVSADALKTYVTPPLSTALPRMDGIAGAGSGTLASKDDHTHPVDTSRLALTGGALSGPLTLAADPTAALDAATKQYVDAHAQAALRYANCVNNSGFSVNQRAYVSGAALAAGVYAHDRWKAGAGGCAYTFTQSGGPSTTITITAGTLQQVVEGLSLAGGTYVLSWTGTAQGRIGAGSYAASPVTATVTAGTNTTIEFNAGTLGQVKLDVGAVPTTWVANAPRDELANCQRFYFNMTHSVQLASYAAVGGNTSFATALFPVTMRAAPTAAPVWAAGNNESAHTFQIITAQGFTAQDTATAAGFFSVILQSCAWSADL